MQTAKLYFSTCLLLVCLAAPAQAASQSAPPISEADVARLAAPEPGAPAAEYRARMATLRLFGTQGAGAAASATLADTSNWITRTYTVGQTIGRGLKLAMVQADAVEILDSVSGARFSLSAGQELRFRLIEHVFDIAAVDHGQHQWTVSSALLARILERYGVGASGQAAVINGVPVIRLSAVRAASALDRLGFQEGDLLVAVNGEPATTASPSAICMAMTRPSSQVVQISLIRRGGRLELAYAID